MRFQTPGSKNGIRRINKKWSESDIISLILSVLIAGYVLYGRVVEKVFAPDDRQTPAFTKQDGVDFIPMPTWKAFLV